MSMIEGVGDEVVVVVSIFLLLCLVLLAWFSTHTRDIPFMNVIIIELSQRRQRSRNNTEGNRQTSQEGVDEQLTEMTHSEAVENALNTSVTCENAPSLVIAGANNNADIAEDGVEDSTSGVPVSSLLESRLPQSSECNSGCQLPSSSQVSESVVNESTTETSASPQTELASGEALPSSETVMIPPFKPQQESGDELRRRRMAYFSSSSGQDGGSAQRETESIGAQSQKSDAVADVRGAESTTASYLVSDRDVQHPHSDSQSPVGSKDSSPSSSPEIPHTRSASETSHSPPTVSSLSRASIPEGSHPGEADSGESRSDGKAGSPASVTVRSSSGVPGSTADIRGSEEGAWVSGGEREMEASAAETISVRLKYLNDMQRTVSTNPHETIGNFRREHFSTELEQNKIVRFIFNGRDLRDDLSTLRAYNIADNSVVHCLITQSQQNEPQVSPLNGQEDDPPQMGALLFPIFGVVLGLVWYFRFTYKQYFNALSTLSLAGISFIYVLMFFSSRQRRHPHQHFD